MRATALRSILTRVARKRGVYVIVDSGARHTRFGAK